jgi:hypothetical protein
LLFALYQGTVFKPALNVAEGRHNPLHPFLKINPRGEAAFQSATANNSGCNILADNES